MTDDSFCRAIAAGPGDTSRRLVYADWLEEQGDPRAEFLRLELQLANRAADDPERPRLARRLQEMTRDLDPAWLARLDRTAIENCSATDTERLVQQRLADEDKDTVLEFEYDCPLHWESLPEGDDPLVRSCATCSRSVYHCASISEAREHAWQGHCVAVDSRLTRTPGDLGPSYPPSRTMGIIALPERRRSDDEDAEMLT